MKAILMLEDGTVFYGNGLGGIREITGEVFFNTSVVGYQELMTDPANAGKILVLTYPLIGNYGINPKFNESGRCWLAGMVIKEKSRIYSNWQAKEGFDEFINNQNLTVLSEVDTRSLTLHLRRYGQMRGIISIQSNTTKELLSKLKNSGNNGTVNFLSKVSVNKPTFLNRKKGGYKLAILDLGVTKSLLRQLDILGSSVCLFPYNTKPDEILNGKFQGLIISSGPEEDAGLKETVASVKGLIQRIPILGISTGHQVLSLALGCRLKKLKVGHHGVNYPLGRPNSLKAEITVQNHTYVVDEDSLSKIKDIKITGYNLNDKSVEEIESKKLKVIGIQYYPVSPGFDEVNDILKRFLKLSKEY